MLGRRYAVCANGHGWKIKHQCQQLAPQCPRISEDSPRSHSAGAGTDRRVPIAEIRRSRHKSPALFEVSVRPLFSSRFYLRRQRAGGKPCQNGERPGLDWETYDWVVLKGFAESRRKSDRVATARRSDRLYFRALVATIFRLPQALRPRCFEK